MASNVWKEYEFGGIQSCPLHFEADAARSLAADTDIAPLRKYLQGPAIRISGARY
jgi:hypothetical protein